MVFQVGWQKAFTYRGASLVFVLLNLINIFLTIGIWTVVYQNHSSIASQSFSIFISYFVLVLLLNRIANSYVCEIVSFDHIKQGELSIYLLKPFSYFAYLILTELPWRIQQSIIMFPASIVLFMLFSKIIVINFYLLFFAFLIAFVGYILSFFIQIFFASFTFWLDDFHGIEAFLETSTLLFSGIGIPIFFFPPVLKTISAILPFQYILYFPISLALNKLESKQILMSSAVMAIWLLTLFFLNKYMWKKGLEKFTGEGI